MFHNVKWRHFNMDNIVIVCLHLFVRNAFFFSSPLVISGHRSFVMTHNRCTSKAQR